MSKSPQHDTILGILAGLELIDVNGKSLGKITGMVLQNSGCGKMTLREAIESTLKPGQTIRSIK